MKRTLSFLTLFTVMLLAFGIMPAVSAQETLTLPGEEREVPAHYLVLEADAAGNVTVVSHQQVMMEGLTSLNDAEFAMFRDSAATRLNDAATVQLFDRSGNLAFQTVVEIPRWLRGEFHNDHAGRDESNIDGHHFELEKRSFVVRVPVIGAGAKLQVQPTFATFQNNAIDLDLAAQQFSIPRAAGVPEFVPGWNNGNSSNRLDILILGDGYTSGQESKFRTDSEDMINDMMAISPYNEYRNYVNVRRIFTVSSQAGADRPACSDSDSGSNDDGTMVNTAFDATFCTNDIWRLLTVNSTKVLNAAAAATYDQIIVIVNTSLYGGSGGSFATGSVHPDAVEIMQHEFGHSFTKLADEYTDAYPGFPACSDTNTSTTDNCEVNVTNQTTRSLIKWNRWIASTTNVPTTSPLADVTAAGLWQGARYLTSGMYRQCFNGLMRSLGTQFCDVDSEAYVLRLYNGGWGTPSAGISGIEPGTRSPSSSSLSVPLLGIKTFSARVLGPIGGPSVNVKWLVNGTTVRNVNAATGSTQSFTYTFDVSGTAVVTLRVTDTSALVHNNVRGSLVNETSWTVSVAGKVCPIDLPNCQEPIVKAGENLLVNGGFDAADGWKANLQTNAQQVCDEATRDAAGCAYQITADANQAVKLTQKIKTPFGAAGDTLQFTGRFDSNDLTGKAKVQITLVYADGSTEKVELNPFKGVEGDPGYVDADATATLRGEVAEAKVKLVVKPGTGTLSIDDFSLLVRSLNVIDQNGDEGLIGLPAAN
jgi:hypothetical protein